MVSSDFDEVGSLVSRSSFPDLFRKKRKLFGSVDGRRDIPLLVDVRTESQSTLHDAWISLPSDVIVANDTFGQPIDTTEDSGGKIEIQLLVGSISGLLSQVFRQSFSLPTVRTSTL